MLAIDESPLTLFDDTTSQQLLQAPVSDDPLSLR